MQSLRDQTALVAAPLYCWRPLEMDGTPRFSCRLFCISAVSCIYDSWCCNFRRVLMARHTNPLNDLPWSVKRVSAAWETNHTLDDLLGGCSFVAPAHPGPLLDGTPRFSCRLFCISAVSCIYDSWCCNFRRVLMARHTNPLNDLPWSVKRVSAAWETNHIYIYILFIIVWCLSFQW